MRILHNVGLNETLQDIASAYHCDVNELIKVNDLENDSLVGVTTLVIPKQNSNFIVIKNSSKEFLIEVTEHNIEDIKDFTSYYDVSVSCNSIKDIEEGDKIILSNKKNYYYVKPLETLPQISKKTGVGISELIKKNNLKTEKVFIGQRLII